MQRAVAQAMPMRKVSHRGFSAMNPATSPATMESPAPTVDLTSMLSFLA